MAPHSTILRWVGTLGAPPPFLYAWPSMSTDRLVVYVSTPPAEAPGLARHLVEQKLAACIQIQAVQSVYRFEGRLEQEPEALLIIKTTRARFEALKAEVLAQHAYTLPEIIALPIEAGHAPYLKWVGEETATP